jgi:membrane associated rhomboid family serine protease
VKSLQWSELRRGAVVMAAVIAGLWLIELLDTITGHALDGLGIRPWNLVGLLGIIPAPLLHFGFAHLAANSVPLFLMGSVLWASGRHEFTVATIVPWITSGLLAWLLTPPGAVIAGASGIVMGWTGYLIARGVLTRTATYLSVGIGTVVLYGSALYNILPLREGVSWQGHLGGLIGGVLAAWMLWAQGRSPASGRG